MLDDVKARNGWQPQDTIRLIFHFFKDLKDAEAQAVKTLVQSLTTEYAGVEFAFLHIIEDHDWMMYDLSSPGVGEGSKVKGKCVPVRGHAVPISRSQMLITTMGPRELKVATHGAPQPLLIQLHREPTFTDLDYLAGQAVEPHASEPAAQTLSRRDAPMAVGQRRSGQEAHPLAHHVRARNPRHPVACFALGVRRRDRRGHQSEGRACEHWACYSSTATSTWAPPADPAWAHTRTPSSPSR